MINVASEKGADKFPWWVDWRGEDVAIVACGESAGNADVAKLKGRVKVLAIKEAFNRLAPFADVVYGCEAPWWTHVQGLQGYGGLRLGWSGAKIAYPGIQRFKIRDKQLDAILVDEPGVIGCGGNSGFQAFNIAVQFGARRILLIGYDMRLGKRIHFYGRNNWAQANNPDEGVMKRWKKAFDASASTLLHLGVEVVNASDVSTISEFPKQTVEETLKAWGR